LVVTTITDADGTTVTTRDHPAGVTAGDLTAGEAATLIVGSFSGGGQATIDWGDGTSSNGLVMTDANGNSTVRGQHSYAASGGYTVTVTVGNSGWTGPLIGKSNVSVAPGSEFGVDGSEPVTVGSPTQDGVPLAIYTDPAFQSSSALVDWGDGSAAATVAVSHVAQLAEILANHVYTTAGLYAVKTLVYAGGTLVGATVSVFFVENPHPDTAINATLLSTPDPRPDAAAIPDGTFTSRDVGLGFPTDPAELLVVPKNAGVLRVELTGLDPTIDKRDVKWDLERNALDVAKAGPGDEMDDQLLHPVEDSLKCLLDTKTQGSFNLIAYTDLNHNSKFDDDGRELIRVLHVAIVNCTIDTSTSLGSPQTVSNPKAFTGASGPAGLDGIPQVGVTTRLGPKPPDGTPGGKGIDAGMFNRGLVGFDAFVYMIGGGKDGKLGLGKITLGWVQDLITPVFMAFYFGANATMHLEPIKGAPLLPWLDTVRPGAGTGGATAFTRTSTQRPKTDLEARGEVDEVLSMDAVEWLFPAKHNGADWNFAMAIWQFVNNLTAFSSDFPRNYTLLGKVPWIALAAGNNDGKGAWANAGAGKVKIAPEIDSEHGPHPAAWDSVVTVGPPAASLLMQVFK
jgi:PKD repeat protein